MRTCMCDECGMSFTIDKMDVSKETMDNGQAVEVVSFTCPKCDSRYIIAVRDEESTRLRDQLQKAQEDYKDSYEPGNEEKMRQAKKQVNFCKRQLMNYMNKLKKKYLKELRRRG